MSRHHTTHVPAISRTQIGVLAALLAVGAAIAAMLSPAPAAATVYTAPAASWQQQTLTGRDVLLLTALDQAGIRYPDPNSVTTAGHAVCLLRSGGAELGAAHIAAATIGWNPFHAAFLVGAATAAYCPTQQIGAHDDR